MTEEEILLNEQRKKIIASMLRKDSNLGNLDYVKNKIRNTKEQIEPYFLGDPVDLDRPGYLTDEMINEMNEARAQGGRPLITNDEITNIDRYISMIRNEERQKKSGIKMFTDDVKSLMKDLEYKKLLGLADALRNPPEGASGREVLDTEYNIDREYPSVSSPINSQRLEYIPGNVTVDRYGKLNVSGNLPTEIIRDDEALMNYYENLRRMR
tara:strand:+ start:46 stop:678 length:633 start_codon:yes stop_codon:yes gene_type:complete